MCPCEATLGQYCFKCYPVQGEGPSYHSLCRNHKDDINLEKCDCEENFEKDYFLTLTEEGEVNVSHD